MASKIEEITKQADMPILPVDSYTKIPKIIGN